MRPPVKSIPVLLLADEPTGALDSRATGEVLDLFDRIHGLGRTIAVITHEPPVARRAQRLIIVRDGHIVGDGDPHVLLSKSSYNFV